MKPLQIGLLILAGAMAGALIMRFTQGPAPAPAPVASVAPVPAPPAPPVEPPPVAETPVADATPAPVPEQPAAVEQPPKPAPPRKAHHAKPVRHSKPAAAPRPEVTTVAQNRPPETPAATYPPAATEPQVPAPPPPPAPAPAPQSPPAAPAEPAPVLTPAPNAVQQDEPPVPQPAPTVTLKSGILVPVRLGEGLSSERNQPGDTFTATLDAPLAADGFVIAERGARVEGRVVEVQKGGHVKGQSLLGLELNVLNTSDGQRVPIRTETFRKQGAQQSTTENVGMVAAAAGIGAVIGAIAGGGKGAGIGAAVGGAAGAGGVAATRGKSVSLGSETQIRFRLIQPVTLTERLDR